jgi:uncharacterized membrane protein YkoI
MPVSRTILAVLSLGLLAPGLMAGPAVAANPPHGSCLSKAEQRAAVADKRAIPLAQAIKSRREKGHRAELVRARLCHRGDELVYMLTLLGHSGRVISEAVDAANGETITGR